MDLLRKIDFLQFWPQWIHIKKKQFEPYSTGLEPYHIFSLFCFNEKRFGFHTIIIKWIQSCPKIDWYGGFAA